MTNATFFELQRARVASITDAFTEELRRRAFARASRDKGDHSPLPYSAPHSRKMNTTGENYMHARLRCD